MSLAKAKRTEILNVCQLNIEGISRSKSEYLSKILRDERIEITIIQETHAADDKLIITRGRIPRFRILAAINHKAHGIVTYARTGIQNTIVASVETSEDVALIPTKSNNVHITNLY